MMGSSDINRSIRSISNYSGGGKGSGGFSRGSQQPNKEKEKQGSNGNDLGSDSGNLFASPILPPIQIHQIPIIKLY